MYIHVFVLYLCVCLPFPNSKKLSIVTQDLVSNGDSF